MGLSDQAKTDPPADEERKVFYTYSTYITVSEHGPNGVRKTDYTFDAAGGLYAKNVWDAGWQVLDELKKDIARDEARGDGPEETIDQQPKIVRFSQYLPTPIRRPYTDPTNPVVYPPAKVTSQEKDSRLVLVDGVLHAPCIICSRLTPTTMKNINGDPICFLCKDSQID